MAYGWFATIDEADSYFNDERLSKSAWDALSDEEQKENVLVQAYNRIYYNDNYSVPTYADATADELVVLKKVNGEMAYYLAVHLADEDSRKGLQAQGVIEAGIVKEKYAEEMLMEVPVPPIVDSMLKAAGFKVKKAFYGVDITRDEDESIN